MERVKNWLEEFRFHVIDGCNGTEAIWRMIQSRVAALEEAQRAFWQTFNKSFRKHKFNTNWLGSAELAKSAENAAEFEKQYPYGFHVAGRGSGKTTIDSEWLAKVAKNTAGFGEPGDAPEKRRAVTAVINNDEGLFLAVSRKNDPNNFGFPGGKVDPGETDEQAIIREVREETGLEFTPEHIVFVRTDHEFICTAYTGKYAGEIHSDEEGRVAWVKPSVLTSGSFGDYNLALFAHMYNGKRSIKDTDGKSAHLEFSTKVNQQTSLP